MRVQTDPAARLERILIRLVRSPRRGTLAESIAEMTRLETDVDPQWQTKAAITWMGICNMVPEIEAAMYQVPDIRYDAYLRPIRQLALLLLDTKLDEPTTQIPLVVERRHIDALVICSDLLSRGAGFSEVESGDASTWASTIDTLANEVSAEEVPSPLRSSLATGLRHIRDGLVDFDLIGPDGVQNRVKLLLGEFEMRSDLQSAEKSDPTGAWSKTKATLHALSPVFGGAQGIIEVGHDIAELQAGDPSPSVVTALETPAIDEPVHDRG